MSQFGFWDYEEPLARLTKGGDPLVKLAAVVDFEPFRYRLEKALKRSDGFVRLRCWSRAGAIWPKAFMRQLSRWPMSDGPRFGAAA